MATRKAVYLVLVCAVFCMVLAPTVDPDMWWHLKTGQVILSQGIPHVDIFSFTKRGSPWITHEWLSEIVMYSLYKAGGFAALMIFFALLGVAIFTLVYLLCAGRPWVAFPVTLFAGWIAEFLWGSRPQIFNILMLTIFLWILENIRQKKIRWEWIYSLPLGIMLWVNLHGGFFLGIAVILVWGFGDALQIFIRKNEEGTLGKKVLQHLVIVFMLCAIAVFFNPNGMHMWLYPFATLTSPAMRDGILEWWSPNFHHEYYRPFLFGLVFSSLVFMASHRRKTFTEMLLCAGVIAAGLISRRHIPFFSVVVMPIVSRALIDSVENLKWRNPFEGRLLTKKLFWVIPFVNIVAVTVAFTLTAEFTRKAIEGNDERIRREYPVEAIKILKQTGLASRNGFNDYALGGFLIWNDIPVFIDGRADMYGDAFFLLYSRISDLRSDWREIYSMFMDLDIQYVLLRPKSMLAEVFRANSDWKEISQEGAGSLFVIQKVPSIFNEAPT